MSQFTFPCPHCQHQIPADESEIGEHVHCPRCHTLAAIPDNRTPRKFAFMAAATREHLRSHGLGFLMASSLDEAVGKARRISMRIYPPKEGWGDHLFHARDCTDNNCDPDKPGEITIELMP